MKCNCCGSELVQNPIGWTDPITEAIQEIERKTEQITAVSEENVIKITENSNAIAQNSENITTLTNLPHVIESGVLNSWNYRKWSDGIKECWRTMGVTFQVADKVSTGVSGLYQCGAYVDLPFAYESTPVSSVNSNWSFSNFVQSQCELNRVQIRTFGSENDFPSTSATTTKQVAIYIIGT